MDIMQSFQKVLDMLQQINMPATYQNISKMGGALEELVRISDEVRAMMEKNNDQPPEKEVSE